MDEFNIVARCSHFICATILAGIWLFRLYGGFGQAGAARKEIEGAFDRWLHRIALIFSLGALLTALAWADSLAVNMGGEWSDAIDPETLDAVLFDTAFGRVWVWRLALAGALVAALVFAHPPWSLFYRVAMGGLSVALLVSIAGASHAAMHTGLAGAVHQCADCLHLLCSGFWLGGLLALGYVVARARASGDWMALARRALARFSILGIGAVGLLLATGIVNAFFLASPRSLIGTAYGYVLIAKIALFAGMIALALFNRRIFLRGIVNSGAGQGQTAAARLSRTIGAEQALGLVVLLLVGILGALPPPH